MDSQQVNSRIIHQDLDTENQIHSDVFSRKYPSSGAQSTHDEEQAERQSTSSSSSAAAAAAAAASYEETYPEGGWEAWIVVLGAFFALFSSMGLMNSIAVFQAYTLQHQLKGHREGTAGWIFSIYNFLAFFGSAYVGPVFDKYGPRWLVVGGTICISCGMMAMSFSTQLWHFILSFGVLAGFGTSLIFTPCIAAIGHWFKARRGFATGLASCAGGFGGIVFPLLLTQLLEHIGYGWTTRIMAIICFICGSIGILLVRSRLPPIENATAHPDIRIFGQIPYTLTTIGIFLLEFSLFIPLDYISTYAMSQGFDETFAFNLIPLMNIGSVVGRCLPGYYSDVIGAFNTCLLSVVLALVGCLGVWLPMGHTSAGIILFSLIFGFASGTSIAIGPVCVGRMCMTQEYGRYYATTYSVVSFACLISIPIGGNIVQASGGAYQGLIILTGCVYVGSAIFLVWAKAAKLGWKKCLAAY